MSSAFHVVVVGAGPGGYAAAIRCAQLGLRTTLVERDALGGVCLNLGCIPSKAMLRSAEVLGLIRSAAEFGLSVQQIDPTYGAIVDRRDRIVARLRMGLTNLLRANGVAVVRGDGRIIGPHTLSVSANGSAGPELSFDSLIIATGSHSAPLPVPGATLPSVIDSDGALGLREAPRRAVVIGAGAVGVEWAEVWRAFGSEVTIVEMLDQLVPTEDSDVARELERAFARKGIQCLTSTRVQAIQSAGGNLEVVIRVDAGERVFPADVVLVAVGRRPNLTGLGVEAAGLPPDPDGIATDGQMRTAVPHVYAVGDVTGRFLLAHVATHQGIIAAQAIAGRDPVPFDEHVVPGAIFTHPEIASVGLRERDARSRGLPVTVGRFPLAASGRAAVSGDTAGFVKIVADEESREVLGVHIVGPGAGDLMGEASLAMRLRATIDDLADTIHVHPTFSEALLEAAWSAAGTPLHVPPLRRET